MVEVQVRRFESVFSRIDHRICCGPVPTPSLRLSFIRHDATGEQNLSGVVNLLMGYLTQYCLRSERRKELDKFEQNLANQRARELFRRSKNSGQAGEFLAYIFIEALLQAPQIFKKMPITTNTEEERKGSD